jgi:uncharacterized protein YjiS (DUF1127 family)
MKKATNPILTVLAALNEMRERARQRRELLELSDCALKDIGLTRVDAIAQSMTPLWR